MNPQNVANDLFGSIDWVDRDTGFLACPGAQFHTGKNSRRDCKIILSGAPTLHCFHSSCKTVIEQENLRLRRAIGGQEFKKREITPEEKEKFIQKKKEQRIQEEIREFSNENKKVIFEKYAWGPADMWEDSPVRLTNEIQDDSKLLLSLFDNNDVVWVGDVMDSGKTDNLINFRTVESWKNEEVLKNFTCPSTFKPESFSRSNSNVVSRKFLVIESDILSQDDICAVFKWCRRFMKLRAVVFTGGKSLHGWFDFPSAPTLEVLKQILPILDCDEALFKPAQPVRLPGVMRNDKYQTLLYLDL